MFGCGSIDGRDFSVFFWVMLWMLAVFGGMDCDDLFGESQRSFFGIFFFVWFLCFF